MLPTEILSNEHKVILSVIAAMEADLAANKINPDKVEKFVDFSRNFSDGCHHAKEEKRLFPYLGQKGMPQDGGPIGVMFMEHDESRTYIKALADNILPAKEGKAEAIEIIKRNMQNYCNLLKNHIFKEDNILFEMANNMLSAADNEELIKQFEHVEKEEIGAGVHEKYHALANELAGK